MEHEYKVGDWVLRPRSSDLRDATPETVDRPILSQIIEIKDDRWAVLHNHHSFQPLWDMRWLRPESFAAWVERARKEEKGEV